MRTYQYDGTFEGLLTCIFEGYNSRQFPDDIQSTGRQCADMFAEAVFITSDAAKAGRVWNGLGRRLSARNRGLFYYAFLSEAAGMEMKILYFARRLFDENDKVETDFGDPVIMDVVQYARKVKKEAMRMKQFIRFQQTKEEIYFCGIEPLYDVLPLVLGHFKSRYADQQWLLYDLKRAYGAFYNKLDVEEITLSGNEINRLTGKLTDNVLNETDALYQVLWKSYFSHISIKERMNLRLQRQHMPRRFWKYLTEMQ